MAGAEVMEEEEEERVVQPRRGSWQQPAWPSLTQAWCELRRQRHICAPIAAMNLLWFAKLIISTMFLGRLGELQLAGGALALTFANVTGFSLLVGLAGGMEPLCSQAFGARRPKAMGYTLQNAILLLLTATIPISLLWLRVELILLRLGHDPSVARLAESYLISLLPDLLAIALLHPLRIFLRCQSITAPLLLCSAAATSLHAPLTFALAVVLKQGARGTAMATCVTDFNLALMLLAYLHRSGLGKAAWSGWSRESTAYWMPLLRLALPSCAMVCLEWWCYEIMLLVSGWLPNPQEEVATMAILLNGDTVFYALESALAASVSTRVGNELGANRPLGAYHAAVVSLGLSIGVALVATIWLTLLRSVWGRLFTSNKKIVVGVGRIAPWVGLMELCNFPQIVSCGVLQASGRLKIGAFVYLGAFYLLGLPIGVCLAFVAKLELIGLWVGLSVAVLSCAIATATLVMKTDWVQQALHAQGVVNAPRDESRDITLRLKGVNKKGMVCNSKSGLCAEEMAPLHSYPTNTHNLNHPSYLESSICTKRDVDT